MSRKLLMPKKPAWAVGTAILIVVSLVAAFVSTFFRPLDPGRGICLWMGIVASVLFVGLALYPARRKALARPFGTAQTWIQLHVWGGLLAAILVLVHQAFRLPGGTMGWLLFLLTLWVTFSGFLGVFLQKYYPVILSRNLTVEVLFDRIPELVGRLPGEGDKLVEGASDVLRGFYQSEVRPSLAGLAPSWGYLTDVRGGRDRRLAPFARITQFLTEDEQRKLEDLKTIFVEKLELDAHYSVQRALRLWTVLHVPPAGVLMGLLAVHVVAFFLY